MAPEISNENDYGYGKAVDWWAVGIILYQLAFGANPFNLRRQNLSQTQSEENVKTLDLLFPEHNDHPFSDDLVDLIT